MSLGSVLVGVAAFLVAAAYLGRPFRTQKQFVSDQSIEAWVARARTEERDARVKTRSNSEGSQDETVARTLSFCPDCGQPIKPSDQFCSRCGTRLGGEAR